MNEEHHDQTEKRMDRAPRMDLIRLEKCATGIDGLDEITHGGLPKGRPTLVCGSAGCGKTLLGIQFLVNGATKLGEPGVFVSFEESTDELAKNVASLGVDLHALIAAKSLAVTHVRIDRSEIEVAGEYDLEGLFLRIGHAIDSVGAKRVVLDTIEALFANLPNEAILRAELRRLFRFLKDKGVTAIITGERGEKTLTRHGLEEYVADCVILLDHRITEQIATRRLRIVKYRGSEHGPDEYPFLIDADGISVLPVTSLKLRHAVSTERISSGIARLDTMLGGEGFFRGSSILVSGSAGTGKSSIAASFVNAACKRGERCLYLAYEESEPQIVRNMRSIGLELQPWIDDDLLRIVPNRATACGLEVHLASIHKAIADFHPRVVVIDPISNLVSVGSNLEVKAMLTRLIDLLKVKQITALFTSLNHDGGPLETTDSHVSSLMDTWLMLRDVELSGERNRLLYLLKSRGMAHSNQAREFLLTSKGIALSDVYLGTAGMLTGTARQVQEAAEKAAALERGQEIQGRRRELERKREAVEARIMALRAESAAEMAEAEAIIAQEGRRESQLGRDIDKRAALRGADEREPSGVAS
jgi:circadian clock protein KaiC